MTTPRTFQRIVATTDFHSALATATPMAAHLHRLRTEALVADCGDFFEGSGYYRLAGGSIERHLLTSLYDVLAPGNHGWPHHFAPDLHPLTVCANAVDAATGAPLFHQLRMFTIGGRRTAITAVISPAAFATIPAHQRQGHQATHPATALREVFLRHHHQVDAWILLSHSGFAADLDLAAQCPFLDVVFTGHCHSPRYAPEPVGDTLVLKGAELGAGYALAEPVGAGWAAHTCTFPATGATWPTPLAPAARQIAAVREKLTAPLGLTAETYRHSVPDRHQLLTEVAARLRTGLGVEAVILNDTALRSQQLGMVLAFGDLLAIEPFANQLVHARVPDAHRCDPHALLTHLTERAGPLAIAPDPLPTGVRSVLTTDYLATNLLGSPAHGAGLSLGQAVRHVLTDSPADDGRAL
ncbi:bifunctional metallophosphatase/5'-nucleotidase [Streptomyces olivoreticuli]|uniref:bifunctional metallophosphatase/5'-nucleotidase n=1 Tax=Streptomyces olivoreticuli TaxID=68246 RepID=UPI00265A6190|nr:bifunctional metallophosphatase/5'-nucleotidase [Streptomyces olivoreticuli]WKK26936.1 bifunctional metallophosphatase/5'-nucleotidase [Streptomyces olivoreticuli]